MIQFLWRIVHLWWIRLCVSLMQPFWYHRKTGKTYHKIVVIGDGIAEGVGDYVVMGNNSGVARRLQDLLQVDARVRHQWNVLNFGRAGTTSEDWLPDGTRFQSTFNNAWARDAEVVCVFLGANDGRSSDQSDPAISVANLEKICSQLRKMGKKIIVAAVPGAGLASKGPSEQNWCTKFNELLGSAVMRSRTDSLSKWLWGPNLSGPKYHRSDMLCSDGLNFSSKAYQTMAKDMLDIILEHIKSVEWSTIKEQLAPISDHKDKDA